MELLREGEVSFEADGVFYNPRMKLCRDIGVAMARSLGIREYLDALSASGIRGMRVAREAGVAEVTLNDISTRACELIQRNLTRNGLECEVTCRNANSLLHERRFQAVDIDPFGSPSPYMAAASRSAGSYLFITATDTAPLCGAHQRSGRRKYMALPVLTEYHREMGARILLGLAARELARVDKAMQPLLTHATDHYVRTYLRVRRGAEAADRCLEDLGYVEHCQVCGGFFIHKTHLQRGCSHCHGGTVVAGPLWLGRIHDPDWVNLALRHLDGSSRARRLLSACEQEVDAPMYYDHHSICERLGITPGRMDAVIERLQAAGFRASRTHFSGLGIKTDAPIGVVEEATRHS